MCGAMFEYQELVFCCSSIGVHGLMQSIEKPTRPLKELPLSTSHPELVSSWHIERNGTLNPDLVSAKSQRKVWWRCLEEPSHEWRQIVDRRIFRGCPQCKLDKRSLASQLPDVAREWHATLNLPLTPKDVYVTSAKQVWWQCPKNSVHTFAAAISNRTSGRSGCPYCSGRSVDETNSLAALRKDLASEWHPALNGDLTPDKVTCGSGLKVWWLCSRTGLHEWECSVRKRTSGQNCQTCLRVRDGHSLEAKFPDIAAEWHKTKNRHIFPVWDPKTAKQANKRVQKNRRLLPSDVAAFSKQSVWWQCKISKEHVWEEKINNRTGKGLRCPYCSGVKITAENSLAAKMPQAEKIWHPSRNLPLTPFQVSFGMTCSVWWRCFRSAKHVWKKPIYQTVKSLRLGHSGCPFCVGRKVNNENSLLAKYPEVAILWHPTRNGVLLPSEVISNSNDEAWWQCLAQKHEWKAIISNIVHSRNYATRGCPFCSGHRVAKENSLAAKCPEVSKYWDKARNLNKQPKHFTFMSNKVVYWRCLDFGDHYWQAAVCYTVRRWQQGKTLCRICARSK